MLKTDKYLNYYDIIAYSWKRVIDNIGLFMGISLIYILGLIFFAVTQYFAQNVMPAAYGRGPAALTNLILSIVSNIWSIVISVGFIRIIFLLIDGYRSPISLLFSAGGCFWRYIAVTFLYGMITMVGFFLLVIPGMIWMVKFHLCIFFVVDKGLGPIDALKASSRATAYMKWHWFGLMGFAGLIMIAGVMCLGIGAFVSYPMGFMMMALGYRQLAAQTPDLEELGVHTMFNRPPQPQPPQQPAQQSFYPDQDSFFI
ncbi:MAG: hypothetical protein ACIAQZ_15290 [Sedimentisphaeraceae bacterium JB056]